MNFRWVNAPIHNAGRGVILREGRALSQTLEYEKSYKHYKQYLGIVNDIASIFGLVLIIVAGSSSLSNEGGPAPTPSDNAPAYNSSATMMPTFSPTPSPTSVYSNSSWPSVASTVGGIFPWLTMFVIGQFIDKWRVDKIQTILQDYQAQKMSRVEAVEGALLSRYQIVCELAMRDIFTNDDLAHQVALSWIEKNANLHFDEDAQKALNEMDAVLTTTLNLLKNRTIFSWIYKEALPVFLLLAIMTVGGFLGQLVKPDQSTVMIQMGALVLLSFIAILARVMPVSSQFLQREDLKEAKNALQVLELVEASAKRLFHALRISFNHADFVQIDQMLNNYLDSTAKIEVRAATKLLVKPAPDVLAPNVNLVIKPSTQRVFAHSSQFFKDAVSQGVEVIDQHFQAELAALRKAFDDLAKQPYFRSKTAALAVFLTDLRRQVKFQKLQSKLRTVLTDMPQNNATLEPLRLEIEDAMTMVANLNLRKRCYNDGQEQKIKYVR